MKFIALIFVNLCFISTAYSVYSGWSTVILSTGEYFISTEERMNWIDALTYCQAYGFDLVKVENVEEQQALYNYINAISMNGWRFYIGGNRVGGVNWKWLDGTDVSNPFWQPGEPNLSGNCIILYGTTWYDHACSNLEYFICEKPPAEATTTTTSGGATTVNPNPSNLRQKVH